MDKFMFKKLRHTCCPLKRAGHTAKQRKQRGKRIRQLWYSGAGDTVRKIEVSENHTHAPVANLFPA